MGFGISQTLVWKTWVNYFQFLYLNSFIFSRSLTSSGMCLLSTVGPWTTWVCNMSPFICGIFFSKCYRTTWSGVGWISGAKPDMEESHIQRGYKWYTHFPLYRELVPLMPVLFVQGWTVVSIILYLTSWSNQKPRSHSLLLPFLYSLHWNISH